jgi:hypothetical protein
MTPSASPLLLVAAAILSQGDTPPEPGPAPAAQKPAGPAHAAGVIEAHFADDSVLKLVLLTESIELHTPYGNLLIPTRDVRRIDFGLRVSADEARRIEAAIADLGHAEYRRRQAASATLLGLREKAYPALLRAAKGSDAEVVRRAEEVLDKLREALPAERLELPDHDVVQTADSKIAGRVVQAVLRVRTFQFGEQQLKVADVRSLGAPAAAGRQAAEAPLPDPGHLGMYQAQVGRTLAFRVTGGQPGVGGVWGTDVYTLDSALALAAVHAGALRPGQTGVVRVTLVGPVAGFHASIRNGVSSGAYGAYGGYRFVR